MTNEITGADSAIRQDTEWSNLTGRQYLHCLVLLFQSIQIQLLRHCARHHTPSPLVSNVFDNNLLQIMHQRLSLPPSVRPTHHMIF